MSVPRSAVRWNLQTAATPGAIAVIQLHASGAAAMDGALRSLGLGPISVGTVSLRDFGEIDRGLVARWAGESVHLMPHGGAAVVKGVLAWLDSCGISGANAIDAEVMYPEAADRIEALMLLALSRAASPMAIDLLLRQPDLWRARRIDAGSREAAAAARVPDARHHLIRPPMVVAIGPSNIGKSTLVNALAGRTVSITADEPGTTRDHVGVMLDLGGLVVRYVDTPGIRDGAGESEREAVRGALELARSADLVIRCGDFSRPPIELLEIGLEGVRSVVLALRSDLGTADWRHDAAVSARNQSGIAELVALLRDTLVPVSVMASEEPWAFWATVDERAG